MSLLNKGTLFFSSRYLLLGRGGEGWGRRGEGRRVVGGEVGGGGGDYLLDETTGDKRCHRIL